MAIFSEFFSILDHSARVVLHPRPRRSRPPATYLQQQRSAHGGRRGHLAARWLLRHFVQVDRRRCHLQLLPQPLHHLRRRAGMRAVERMTAGGHGGVVAVVVVVIVI